MDGLLPGPLPSNLEDLSTGDQAEYRLQLRLANRHKWYSGQGISQPSSTSGFFSATYRRAYDASYLRHTSMGGWCI